MYGWIGQVLHIDLTKGSVSIEPLDKNLAHRFSGMKSRMSLTTACLLMQ